ncbi:type IVB secretion system protein IcmW [Vibrio alginolyticus]|uniref:type IVB secretion system protein IcmW n=1 Tax=Vibrio alginolyticus TaxID=663 RepID=UPI0015F6DDC6|nr:hypothetical protein [Vibrio alginolyticus]EJE4208689.1 hypothetical protein [Vibrio parahaemolyticus]
MFNNRDLDSWVANFSEPVKAILQQAAEAEDWPTDNEPEVQELLNLISSLGTSTHSAVFKAERDEGDVDLYRKVLRDLSPEELVELQAQFIYPRALKLFGDTVSLDPEIAKKLVNTGLMQHTDETVGIGYANMVNRLLLLTKMSIFQQVFTDYNQIDFVMEALENYEL